MHGNLHFAKSPLSFQSVEFNPSDLLQPHLLILDQIVSLRQSTKEQCFLGETILLVLRLETIMIVIVKFLWEIGMCYH